MKSDTILIVEDDAIIAEHIRDILLSYGYNVPIMVSSGEDAVLEVIKCPPDLILMDIRLRGTMNGIETASRIMSYVTIPVIYMTAYSDENFLKEAKITEPYGYLIKPVVERELHASIEMALYKHKMDIKLKESEELYHSLFSQSPDPIYLFDIDTKAILEANPSFCRLFGYRSEEINNLAIYDIIAHDRESIQENIEKVLAVKQYTVGERLYLNKQGFTVDVEVHASLINYGGREVFCVIAHDLTERKEFEKEFRQRYKMEAIHTMAGGIAHNFNNILASVVGFIELVMLDMTEDNISFLNLRESLKSAARAKELIRQIITFTCRNNKKRKILEISAAVNSMTDLIKASLPENIQFHAHIDSKHFVLVDEDQIEQILIHLSNNAVYSMEKSGGLLEISLSDVNMEEDRKIPSGHYVKLKISDTGCGIDTDIMEKIFDPFFTTRNMAEARGMGLSIVYGIVRSCNGFIKVFSRINEGTAFEIYLPVFSDKI